MLWLVTLLFCLLSLQLGQCFPQAHAAHGDEHVAISLGTPAPPTDDCEPGHHAHKQHTATDAIHRTTRGTADTTWSAILFENTFSNSFRSPGDGSGSRFSGRDPCSPGRALLIEICVTRT